MSETNGQQPQSGALVTIPEHTQPEQTTLFDPTTPLRPAWCSFRTDSEEGFALLSRMKHGDRKPIDEFINLTIGLVNAYIQTVERLDEKTGELVRFPFIALQLDTDEIMTCGSTGIFGSLVDILRFRKETPWKPPVRVKVVKKQLRDGKTTYALLYVAQAGAGEQKKGGRHV